MAIPLNYQTSDAAHGQNLSIVPSNAAIGSTYDALFQSAMYAYQQENLSGTQAVPGGDWTFLRASYTGGCDLKSQLDSLPDFASIPAGLALPSQFFSGYNLRTFTRFIDRQLTALNYVAKALNKAVPLIGIQFSCNLLEVTFDAPPQTVNGGGPQERWVTELWLFLTNPGYYP